MPIGRVLVFLTVVTSIVGGVHWYFWARLVRDAALPMPWSRIATGVIVGLAVAMPLTMIGTRLLPRAVIQPLAWVVFTWMGVLFFLLVLLLATDLARLGAWLVERAQGGETDPARRLFLSQLAAGVASVGALGVSTYGLFEGLRPVAIKRVRVPLTKLPEALSGTTIVQMTDIHVGPTIGQDFIEDLVRKSNALEPDIVAITGDLVDGTVAELGEFVAPLRGLRARHGVYFVTGNHEYYSGADEWIAFLGTLGIRVLRNERVEIARDGAVFDLAGVDDWTAHQFGGGHGADLDKALAGRDESRALVLLAHQPKQALAAADKGVCLQLSGHTHGGQMFPFNFLVKLEQPFVAGLDRLRDLRIYTSNGTGYWGPPMRVAAPAEITRIELVRGSA